MRTIGMIDTNKEPKKEQIIPYEEMKKSELIELCQEKGIELKAADKRSKEALIAALKR